MIFLDVIRQQYRMAGVLKGPGRDLSVSEQQEGLHINNSMLDGLKIERLFVYQVVRTVFDVTALQQEYLVGALVDGANWEIERPEKILRAGFIVATTPPTLEAEIEMEVVQTYSQWAAIITKQVQSAMPRVIYYRATLPCGTAATWPVANKDCQIALYTPGLVDEFTDVMADIQFPKGYREFVEYEGACKVHARYPHLPMDPSVAVEAKSYKMRIKANQYTPLYIGSDPAALKPKPSAGRKWYDARSWSSG